MVNEFLAFFRQSAVVFSRSKIQSARPTLTFFPLKHDIFVDFFSAEKKCDDVWWHQNFTCKYVNLRIFSTHNRNKVKVRLTSPSGLDPSLRSSSGGCAKPLPGAFFVGYLPTRAPFILSQNFRHIWKHFCSGHTEFTPPQQIFVQQVSTAHGVINHHSAPVRSRQNTKDCPTNSHCAKTAHWSHAGEI